MSETKTENPPGRFARIERRARVFVPVVVSLALLAWIFDRIDIRLALDYVTLDVFLRFFGPLAFFSLVTIVIEAQSLHRVIAANPQDATPISRLVAARIKAACYLLGILNHLLGAAGLGILVRRRTGASIAAAAGIVILIALLDVGSVLACIALGASLLQVEAFGLRLGLVFGLVASIVAVFAFLKAPIDLGVLERVRNLPLFRAPRQASLSLLIELGCLRVAMVAAFVALVRGLFFAFDVDVPLVQLVFGVGVMLTVSAIPLAVAGIGTGQVVFVAVFRGLAGDPELLAMSIVLSTSIIVSRAGIGLLFAPEFTREAISAAKREAAGAGDD